MSLSVLCQRCGKPYDHWHVRQAEFSVGRIDHWKLQLCERCTEDAETALRGVLQPPTWPEQG